MEYEDLFYSLEQLISLLSDYVLNVEKEIEAVPEYDKMNSRRVLYTKYGKIAEISNEISRQLSLAYRARAKLKMSRRNIYQDHHLPGSLTSRYKAQMEYYETVLQDVIESLKYKKEGIDSLFRFYSSVQYILGSPRLDTMD